MGECRSHPPLADTAPIEVWPEHVHPSMSEPEPETYADDGELFDGQTVELTFPAVAPGTWRGRWPGVASDDWCGAWEPRLSG